MAALAIAGLAAPALLLLKDGPQPLPAAPETRPGIGDFLLRRPGTGEARWSQGASFEGFDALRAAHPEVQWRWSDEPRLPVAAVTLARRGERVRRHALVLPGGATAEFPVRVPPWGVLEFHHAFLSAGAPGTPAVEVVEENGAARTLFTAPAGPAKRHGRRGGETWKVRRLDLAPWAGRNVRLRFKGGAPGTESTAALWADPVVRGVDRPRRAPGTSGASIALAVWPSARGDGVGLDGFSDATPPRLRRLFLEGAGVHRFYTNATERAWAWRALISGRRPRSGAAPEPPPAYWPQEFRTRGYRTAAVGAFTDAELGLLGEAGFDEVVALGGEEATAAAAAESLRWLDREGGPYLLVLFLGAAPGDRLPPARFWVGAAPLRRALGSFGAWRQAAERAYVDEYLGRFLDGLEAREERPVVSALSLAGAPASRHPVRRGGRRLWARRYAPGHGLRESEVRAVWCIDHPALPSARLLSGPAQLVDVGPSLLALTGAHAEAGDGRAVDFRRASLRDDPSLRIAVRGRAAKALLVDGHYKYIRHAPAPGLDYPREEVFDLWSDPNEERNLVAARRTLLARLRQVMDEVDPDPVEVRLSLQGANPVEGSVTCSAGKLDLLAADADVQPRGPYEFGYSLTDGKSLTYATWPPSAPYMLMLLSAGRYIPSAGIRVSGLGLPLFEQRGEGWHDRTKFSWMEGWPGTAAAPGVYLGRREKDPVPPLWPDPVDRSAPPSFSRRPPPSLVDGLTAPAPAVVVSTAPAAVPAISTAPAISTGTAAP